MANYNPKVYTDKPSETSLEALLFLSYRKLHSRYNKKFRFESHCIGLDDVVIRSAAGGESSEARFFILEMED